MQTRKRVVALIIKDKKILLVKGKEYSELWTPSGKQEAGESEEETLERELLEETSLILKSMKFYRKYSGKSPYSDKVITETSCFFATVEGNPKPDKEIEKIIWYSQKDFLEKNYSMIPANQEKLIPDLISDGYL